MKATTVPTTRAIAYSSTLQARLAPIVDARSGALSGLDFRLFRLVAGAEGVDGFAATQAGHRIPLEAIRAVGEALLAMAGELGE